MTTRIPFSCRCLYDMYQIKVSRCFYSFFIMFSRCILISSRPNNKWCDWLSRMYGHPLPTLKVGFAPSQTWTEIIVYNEYISGKNNQLIRSLCLYILQWWCVTLEVDDWNIITYLASSLAWCRELITRWIYSGLIKSHCINILNLIN